MGSRPETRTGNLHKTCRTCAMASVRRRSTIELITSPSSAVRVGSIAWINRFIVEEGLLLGNTRSACSCKTSNWFVRRIASDNSGMYAGASRPFP